MSKMDYYSLKYRNVASKRVSNESNNSLGGYISSGWLVSDEIFTGIQKARFSTIDKVYKEVA